MSEEELAQLEAIWAPLKDFRREDVSPYWAAERAVEVLALIAEVRRLRGVVSQAALTQMQHEATVEAAFQAGYEKGKHNVGEFWPAARQLLRPKGLRP